MVAKENISFKKMKPPCLLKEKHGVELGASYQNDVGCALFVEAIAADLHAEQGLFLTKWQYWHS